MEDLDIKKNMVLKIFHSLSDDEVKKALRELKEDEVSGVVRQGGMVRMISEQISSIIEQPTADLLFLTQSAIYREAAYRFVK